MRHDLEAEVREYCSGREVGYGPRLLRGLRRDMKDRHKQGDSYYCPLCDRAVYPDGTMRAMM